MYREFMSCLVTELTLSIYRCSGLHRDVTEQSLHNQLKEWYMGESAITETAVDGYVVDVVKDGLLIEVQTGNFSAIKDKLKTLLKSHRVRLVHPVSRIKWIIRLDAKGDQVSRRKSPKRGRVEEVFYELVYIPDICKTPGFELEVLLVDAEEYLIDDGKGSWRRRRWSIHDRRLVEVVERFIFRDRKDYLGVLPEGLPHEFTARQLSKASRIGIGLAQKMVYCLQRMKVLDVSGKKGRSNLYIIKG
jgi:hypothetical protein